jgi:hypothetical protein
MGFAGFDDLRLFNTTAGTALCVTRSDIPVGIFGSCVVGAFGQNKTSLVVIISSIAIVFSEAELLTHFGCHDGPKARSEH